VRPRPVDVAGLTDAAQIIARDGSTCARRRKGGVVCWGRAPDKSGEQLVPTPVAALDGAIEIAFGKEFLCGLMVRTLTIPLSPEKWGHRTFDLPGPLGRRPHVDTLQRRTAPEPMRMGLADQATRRGEPARVAAGPVEVSGAVTLDRACMR
jgi:hypothetical protein